MLANERNELAQKKRDISKGLGWAVYAGGVVVAWAFTLAFFLRAMQGNPLLQIIVGIGITFVGINAVVLANALHHYAVSGWHRGVAIALYSVDLILMLVNILVSAGELTGNLPAWAKVYEPYVYSTIVIPVITWGVLWILDPWQRADVQKQAEKDRFILKVIRQAGALIDSEEGRGIVAEFAHDLASNQIFNGDPLGIGKGKSDTGTSKIDTGKSKKIESILAKAGFDGQAGALAKEIMQDITDPT